MRLMLLVLLLCLCSCGSWKSPKQWTLFSPDRHLAITVHFGPELQTSGPSRLYYYVITLPDSHVVIQDSPLGISRDDQDFVFGLTFYAASSVKVIAVNYEMTTGKRRALQDHCHEQTLIFKNSRGAKVELVLRAYNDGVAIRYRFPEQGQQTQVITEELTGFKIPANGKAFMQPYDEAAMYTPAYEAFYQNSIGVGTASPNKAGWSFPALFQLASEWVEITEAGLDENYCGCRLAQEAVDGLYRLRFPDPAEGNGTGSVHPASTLPWATPWRVIMVGKSLDRIVESCLVTHLSSPSLITDPDWIKPGRAAWSWWSEPLSPKNPATLIKFVDLAAEMKWEYFLVDANWNEMAPSVIPELVQYAKSKRVGILLWYNSGGPHNSVTEAPRDRMFDRETRRKEMQWLRDIGVKGVKVDFFQSDKQNIIRHYLNILKDAADFQLLVNFHGCTLPRGWQRTYPHLMSMEGVRGAENYIFDKSYPAAAPWHNTILAFTRNVVGSMDYTPVTFSDHNNPHVTTWGHELALSVVFESGWQHFADRISAYRQLPIAAKTFMQHVPTVWDETKFISGEPGTFVVLARRNGETWYYAGINGLNTTQTVQWSFSQLTAERYQAVKIYDGEGPRQLIHDTNILRNDDKIQITMPPYGGFVIQTIPTAG